MELIDLEGRTKTGKSNREIPRKEPPLSVTKIPPELAIHHLYQRQFPLLTPATSLAS